MTQYGTSLNPLTTDDKYTHNAALATYYRLSQSGPEKANVNWYGHRDTKTVKRFAIYRVQEVLTFQMIGRETVNSKDDMADLEGQKILPAL